MLSALRARDWWYFALLPVAGLGRENAAGSAVLLQTAAGITGACAILGFAYGLNSLSDRALDADPRKNPLAGGRGDAARVKRLVVVAAAAALVLAALRGAGAHLTATVVALAAGFAYSAPPRLKAVPFVGTMTNVGIFTPLFWLGAPLDGGAAGLWGVFVLLLLQNQLLHEEEDLPEDLRARIVTTAAMLGRPGVRITCVGLAVVAALVGVTQLGGAALAAALLTVGAATAVTVRSARGSRRRDHGRYAVLGGALVYLAERWL